MICSAHQVHFLPYLGLFDKLLKSDIFILVDDFQYVKQSHQNRNLIKTISGPLWLSIPVTYDHMTDLIKDVKIANHDFIQAHLGSIRSAYSKAKYYNEYFPRIEEIYLSCARDKFLTDVSMKFFNFILEVLESRTKVVHIRDLQIPIGGEPTRRIAKMCKAVDADVFLSGDGARAYLLEDVLNENGINLLWQNFKHPVYEQKWGEFIPNMCVLDALFNIGPELKNIIGR